MLRADLAFELDYHCVIEKGFISFKGFWYQRSNVNTSNRKKRLRSSSIGN